MLILLDGSKGAGKSSVGDILIKRIPNAVHLGLDNVRRALPNQDKTRRELNQDALEIILEKTKENLKENITVIIDCGLTDERVTIFESIASTAATPICKIHLKASYETLLARVKSRDKISNRPTNVDRFDEVYKIIHSKDFSGFHVIETDRLSVEEIVDEILAIVQDCKLQEL